MNKESKKDDRFNKEPFIPDEMVKALMPFILQAIDDLYDEVILKTE